MELEKPPSAPTLLKSYRWRTAAPVGDSGSPGTRRWTRGWRRSHSHPETESTPDTQGGSTLGAPKASTRRSLFQRAFSAPAKGAREPRLGAGGGRDTLGWYLHPRSRRRGHPEGTQEVAEEAGLPRPPSVPPPDAPVLDVNSFSLVDGHLVLVDHEAGGSSRTRSCILEATRRDPGNPPADNRSPRGPGRSPECDPSPGSQFSSVKGLLWRRLWERRGRSTPRPEVPNGHRVPTWSSSRESLLPAPSAAELDLTGDSVVVRPVHGSIMGERFCFQIITGASSHCFGCSTLAERDRWIETLRRAAQPNKDNCERLELALNLWIYEGRDLPPRHRLRCHLLLDGTLFAQTTAKVAGADGDLFWGELFHLAALPPTTSTLTLTLYRDNHHPSTQHPPPAAAVASITIPLAELAAARQPLERWYLLGGTGGGDRVPALRVRGRYREVRVLPIVRYKELAEFITFHYRELCSRLEPAIALRHKEELAGALVRVLQSTGKAKSFLIDLGVAELDRLDEREALIFRENTLATKAIEEYMKLVGGNYLQATLGEVVARLCSSEDNCEVDPSRCSGLELCQHQSNLRRLCQETFRCITASCDSFPVELGEVFSAWQEECEARGKAPIGQRLVVATLFLRFLCPAIMSPSLFGLVQQYPSEPTARTLTLVAKVIQNLANFSMFGEKEAYMAFMNDFLEHNHSPMRDFLSTVANPESSGRAATYDGYLDLALELATLHLLLCDIFLTLDQVMKEELEPLPTILTAIREGTPIPVSVRLCSSMERSHPGSPQPDLVAPQEPSQRSPLPKSQSLTSIRRSQCSQQHPSPLPVPTGRSVQRTQSVPAQHKGAQHRCGSTQHLPDDPSGGGRLRPAVPRKPSVPWQRPAQEAAAQGELCSRRPLEKHGRWIEELRREVAVLQEELRLLGCRVGDAEGQLQGLQQQGLRPQELERLQVQLEEATGHIGNLGARLLAAEGCRKKDLERLKSSEEKNRVLERRLWVLQEEQQQLQGALSQLLGAPTGRRGRQGAMLGPDDDDLATSV